jgi:hypothetical protein
MLPRFGMVGDKQIGKQSVRSSSSRPTHYERVECEMVVDGQSGQVLDPCFGVEVSEGKRRSVLGVRGHVGGVGLQPQPLMPGWLEKTGSELMYALNLGTWGVQEALDVLEYANVPSGAELSDLRIKNGRVRPHATKMWCLGNEMDGPGSSATRTITANSRRGRRRRCGSSTPHWSWWFAEAPTPTCRPSGPRSTRSSSTPTTTSTTSPTTLTMRSSTGTPAVLGVRREHGSLHRVGSRNR